MRISGQGPIDSYLGAAPGNPGAQDALSHGRSSRTRNSSTDPEPRTRHVPPLVGSANLITREIQIARNGVGRAGLALREQSWQMRRGREGGHHHPNSPAVPARG
jgi:hypothetical protein